MRLLRLALTGLALSLTACPAPNQIASSESLTGFWRPHDGAQTVFVFAPASDGEAWFDLSANGVAPQTQPLSAVYEMDSLVQLATYEATATELKQTVLVDQGAEPGTQYSTRIHGFERGVKLTLESKKTMGPRDWDGYDFCPRSRVTGWGQNSVTGCSNALATGGSAAYGPDGTLYVYTGSGRSAGAPNACEAPGFLELGPGCRAVVSEAPNAIGSAMHVYDDGTLRLALIDTTTRELRMRERAPGAKDFTQTTLRALNVGTSLTLLDHAAGPLLVTGAVTDGGTPLAFQRADTGWAAVELKPTSTGTPLTNLVAATVDPMKRLWVASGKQLWAEGDTSFTSLEAPGAVQSLYVDPEGTPHALFTAGRGLEYGVYRAGVWERHVIDDRASGTIVTHGTRPLRALVTAPAFPQTPWLHPTVITIFDDGHVESDVSGGPFNFINAVSTTFGAVGPRGEIAASLTGEAVMTRSPRGRLYPGAMKLDLEVRGPPIRLFSEDGRFSCDSKCTVDATEGERIAFKVEPKPGLIATLESCDRQGRVKSAPCYVTMVAPMSASTAPANPLFRVTTRETPLAEAVSAANAQGLATTFGVSGTHLAVAVLFTGNANQYLLDGVTVPVTGSFESQGLVTLDRATGTASFVAVPNGVSIDAVKPDGAGGLYATLLTTNLPAMVGGASVGASQQQVLSLVHVTPAAVVDRNVTLLSAPRTMPFGVLGTALLSDGTAAAVVSQSAPLTSLGVTESNALIRVAADGTKTAHGFSSALGLNGEVSLVSAERVAFVVNVNGGATLFTWTSGQLSTAMVPTATAYALHATPDATVLAVTSPTDTLQVGTTTLTGRKHLLRFDASLGVSATFSSPTFTNATWSWGVGVTSKGIGFLSDGELRWLSPSLSVIKTVPLATTTQRISGVPGLSTQVDGDALWILARPDMDFGDVTGSTAIAKLDLF